MDEGGAGQFVGIDMKGGRVCLGAGSHRDKDRRVYEDTPAKARITHPTARQSRPRAPSSDTPPSDRIPMHHEDAAHDHLS